MKTKEFDYVSSPSKNDSERVIKKRVNIISINGDERIIRKFLFKPLYICGERRWLEFAEIKQKKVYIDMDIPYWENVEWIY